MSENVHHYKVGSRKTQAAMGTQYIKHNHSTKIAIHNMHMYVHRVCTTMHSHIVGCTHVQNSPQHKRQISSVVWDQILIRELYVGSNAVLSTFYTRITKNLEFKKRSRD